MDWTIEMIEKARAIYQAKYGGDYFENGEIFIRVTAALRDAAQQGTAATCAHTNRVHGTQNDWCGDCGFFPLDTPGADLAPAPGEG